MLGRALCMTREMAQTVAATWPLAPIYEEPVGLGGGGGKSVDHTPRHSIAGSIGGDMALTADYPGAIGGLPCEPALQVVRYLVSFAWALKATLREPGPHCHR